MMRRVIKVFLFQSKLSIVYFKNRMNEDRINRENNRIGKKNLGCVFV